METLTATGRTWTVWFQWDGDDPEPMIAVALTVDRALEEAHYSLAGAGFDYTILGIARDDKLAIRI